MECAATVLYPIRYRVYAEHDMTTTAQHLSFSSSIISSSGRSILSQTLWDCRQRVVSPMQKEQTQPLLSGAVAHLRLHLWTRHVCCKQSQSSYLANSHISYKYPPFSSFGKWWKLLQTVEHRKKSLLVLYCPIYFLPGDCRGKLAIQITLVQMLYCTWPLFNKLHWTKQLTVKMINITPYCHHFVSQKAINAQLSWTSIKAQLREGQSKPATMKTARKKQWGVPYFSI